MWPSCSSGGSVHSAGKLIRSAVSRQREFLADASAIQYTRNPLGIGGALKKIGGLATGSRLTHPARAEMSHMFFGAGLPSWNFSQLFHTHPPLEERIRRIEPSFEGSFEPVPAEFVARWAEENPNSPRLATAGLGGPVASGSAEHALPSDPTLLDRLGAPGPEHLEYARRLMASLPQPIKDAAREPQGARALAYALFGSTDSALWGSQRLLIEKSEGVSLATRSDALREQATELDRRARLPLVEMLSGTLRGVESSAHDAFRANVRALVEADRRLDLGEWVLLSLLVRTLDRHFRPSRSRRARYSPTLGPRAGGGYPVERAGPRGSR